MLENGGELDIGRRLPIHLQVARETPICPVHPECRPVGRRHPTGRRESEAPSGDRGGPGHGVARFEPVREDRGVEAGLH